MCKVPFLLPQISREMASFTGGNVGEKGICIDTPVIGTQQSSNRIAFKKKFFQYKRREKRCSPIFQIKIHFISNKYTLSTDFPVRSGHSGDHLRLYTANERVWVFKIGYITGRKMWVSSWSSSWLVTFKSTGTGSHGPCHNLDHPTSTGCITK